MLISEPTAWYLLCMYTEMQFNQNTAKQIKLLDINQNIENNHNCTTKNLDQQQHFFEYFRICPVCLDCPNVSMFLAMLAKLNLIIPNANRLMAPPESSYPILYNMMRVSTSHTIKIIYVHIAVCVCFCSLFSNLSQYPIVHMPRCPIVHICPGVPLSIW